MEDIITRFDRINSIICALKNSPGNVEKLENIIIQLEEVITTCELSEEACEESIRHRIISKCLFPQYWKLSEHIGKLDADGLIEFEKTYTS